MNASVNASAGGRADFQLPLSGSRDHPDRGAATLPYPDLSTPSLGITHVRAHALPQEDTFQLPLSGSLGPMTSGPVMVTNLSTPSLGITTTSIWANISSR